MTYIAKSAIYQNFIEPSTFRSKASLKASEGIKYNPVPFMKSFSPLIQVYREKTIAKEDSNFANACFVKAIPCV